MQTIHKTNLRSNYAKIPNEVLRSKLLSFRAKGILAMMLSNSDIWRMSIKSLSEFSGGEGITATRTAVHELEAAGYAVRGKSSIGENGQYTGYIWKWYDTPVPVKERTNSSVRKSNDGKSHDGFPDDGKPHDLRTKIKKEENKKEASVLNGRTPDPTSFPIPMGVRNSTPALAELNRLEDIDW